MLVSSGSRVRIVFYFLTLIFGAPRNASDTSSIFFLKVQVLNQTGKKTVSHFRQPSSRSIHLKLPYQYPNWRQIRQLPPVFTIAQTEPTSENESSRAITMPQSCPSVLILCRCEKWNRRKILHRYSESKNFSTFFFDRIFFESEKYFSKKCLQKKNSKDFFLTNFF